MSKDLATINVESPIEVNLEDTKMEADIDETEKLSSLKIRI